MTKDDAAAQPRAPRMQIVSGAILPPVVVVAAQLVLEIMHSALVAASAAAVVPGGAAVAAWAYTLASAAMLGVPFVVFYRLVLRSWLREDGADEGDLPKATRPRLLRVGAPTLEPRRRLLRAGQLLRAILLVVGLALVLQALNGVCRAYVPWMFDSFRSAQGDAAAESSMSAETSLAVTVASIVSGCVIAPVFEELWFRGAWLTGLARAGVPFAIANILQAVVFGLLHFSLYQALSAMLLGVVLGLLAERTRSVVPGMVTHALHNLVSNIAIVPQLLHSLGFFRASDALANISFGAGLDACTTGLLLAVGVVGLLLVAFALRRTPSVA